MRRVLRAASELSPAVAGTCVASRAKGTGDSRGRLGFSRPLEKAPQVKQGGVNAIARRVPGTAKLTYTNKKGRTFNFSVPVSQITHPQSKLVSPIDGKWKELDTSYCDTGDLNEDMPFAFSTAAWANTLEERPDPDTPVSPAAMETAGRMMREASAAFQALCSDYVLMDTSGQKTMLTYSELNSGPDYEHNDRKVRRRRHWLSIRRQFALLRERIWPSVGTSGEAVASVDDMYDVLRWLDSANTFCIRKARPYDTAEETEFTALDLRREVEILAAHVSRDAEAFFGGAPAATPGRPAHTDSDRFVTCAALARKYCVPVASFFAPPPPDSGRSEGADEGRDIMVSLPAAGTLRSPKSVIRVMWLVISCDSGRSVRFSNPHTGEVDDEPLCEAVRRLMSVGTLGVPGAMESIDGDDLCTYLRFCSNVSKQNPAFFQHGALHGAGGRFAVELQHYVQLGISRCRDLLYQRQGVQTTVISEDEFIPLVDLQQHTEHGHKDALVHYKLGKRSAQGLRPTKLDGRLSTMLAELLVELRSPSATPLRGDTLLQDLINHISLIANASKVSLSLDDVIRLLPIVAELVETSSQPEAVAVRLDRIFSTVSNVVGFTIQSDTSTEQLILLLEGLAACSFVPTSFQRVEMVLLRRIVAKELGASELRRAAVAIAKLQPGSASQLLLHNIALGLAELNQGVDLLDQLHILLALHSGGYTQLTPFLLSLPDRATMAANLVADPEHLCALASLLAKGAVDTEELEELQAVLLHRDALTALVRYMTDVGCEHNMATFCRCVTTLAVAASGVPDGSEERVAATSAFERYVRDSSLDPTRQRPSSKECGATMECLVRLEVIAEARSSGAWEALEQQVLAKLKSFREGVRLPAESHIPSRSGVAASLTLPRSPTLKPGTTLSNPLGNYDYHAQKLVREARNAAAETVDSMVAAAAHVLRCHECVTSPLLDASAEVVVAAAMRVAASSVDAGGPDGSQMAATSTSNGALRSFEMGHLQREHAKRTLDSNLLEFCELLRQCGRLQRLEDAMAG